MKLRAKVNGNIIEVTDKEQARALLASGYYEQVKKAPATKPPVRGQRKN